MGYKCQTCISGGRTLKADTDTGEYIVLAVDGSIECSGYFYDPTPEEIMKHLNDMGITIW